MKKVESVNLERIVWCLTDRGIRPAELGAEVGIDPKKLEAILRGESHLSVGQLKRISKYFNKGLLFFFDREPVDERRLRTTGFRTLTNENPQIEPRLKALMERVERYRQLYLGLREDRDEEIENFSPPVVWVNSAKASASEVRRWLSLNGNGSFENYRKVIESKGILVFRSNGYAGQWQVPSKSPVAGFSIVHRIFPIIFVRKASESRQLFTLAHELGHLLLHTRGFVDDEGDLYSHVGKERDANAFAGNLLVPDEFLVQIDDRERPSEVASFDAWLRQPAIRWGVSVEVVLRRLLDSNRLARAQYEGYRQFKRDQTFGEASGGSREYRYREPRHILGDNFVKTVLDALHSKQITITRASSYLDNIKVTDIHKLERVYNAP